MLQNKYTFNQSSVEFEITGLPDLSQNDDEKNITIISTWKLSILNQPDIEGDVEHLKSIIKAFYKYSSFILLNKDKTIESNLININLDEDGFHRLLLKSTKPNVQPMNLTIGNAEFSDIINCFDQLKNCDQINIDFSELIPSFKKPRFYLSRKSNIFEIFLPPILAIFSISFIALISINIYDKNDSKDKNISVLINSKTSNSTISMIRL